VLGLLAGPHFVGALFNGIETDYLASLFSMPTRTGQTLLDEDFLRAERVTDCSGYACVPGTDPPRWAARRPDGWIVGGPTARPQDSILPISSLILWRCRALRWPEERHLL
jgi:hypothetical protein